MGLIQRKDSKSLEEALALLQGFGSDLLGGISIITFMVLGEYLAGSIIVIMLSGGEALESYPLRSASSVLAALAKRMPSIAPTPGTTSVNCSLASCFYCRFTRCAINACGVP
jgi:cation transport ATPase